jgi:hypothetical protein
VIRHHTVLSHSQDVAKSCLLITGEKDPVAIQGHEERDKSSPFVSVEKGMIVSSGMQECGGNHLRRRILCLHAETRLGPESADSSSEMPLTPGG